MFELSNSEINSILRCQNVTSNQISSKRRYKPYAFTEQGIYMLMTVLKGELAMQQSIALKKSKGICHDRWIIIDYNTQNEQLFISGASSKDAGNKITTIMKEEHSELYHPLIDKIFFNK